MKQIKKNLWIVWGVSMFIWLVSILFGAIEISIIFAGIAVMASAVNAFN